MEDRRAHNADVHAEPLPGRFEQLARELQPQAIMDDVQYRETLDMVDRLMSRRKLTKGQELYMETLVQLVQVYEARVHDIDAASIRGIDLLRHLLEENDMSASDLARVLGVYASMGSKILKGNGRSRSPTPAGSASASGCGSTPSWMSRTRRRLRPVQ